MIAVARSATVIAAVGAAAAGGALFTFSSFTVKGLSRLPPSQGAAAMQEINRAAPTPLFMVILFGTGAVSAGLGISAGMGARDRADIYRLAACAIYGLGVVGLTVGYHVPRNNRLASLDAHSEQGADYWSTYLAEWVRANHVRTAAALMASALLTASLATD